MTNTALSFRKKPFEYISRIRQTDEILEDLSAEHPVSQVYMLTGGRGSGKTVMMQRSSGSYHLPDPCGHRPRLDHKFFMEMREGLLSYLRSQRITY